MKLTYFIKSASSQLRRFSIKEEYNLIYDFGMDNNNPITLLYYHCPTKHKKNLQSKCLITNHKHMSSQVDITLDDYYPTFLLQHYLFLTMWFPYVLIHKLYIWFLGLFLWMINNDNVSMLVDRCNRCIYRSCNEDILFFVPLYP